MILGHCLPMCRTLSSPQYYPDLSCENFPLQSDTIQRGINDPSVLFDTSVRCSLQRHPDTCSLQSILIPHTMSQKRHLVISKVKCLSDNIYELCISHLHVTMLALVLTTLFLPKRCGVLEELSKSPPL